MLRYQCNQPVPSCIEKWISPDHKRSDMLLGKRSKASINTLIASTMENNEALSKRARRFLHVFRLGLPDIRVRVYKQGYNVRT